MSSRLAGSASPYLRAHADQPVPWYPWGHEAFDVARERDVPVMVSVGYSTCHWCHVMSEESFSDADTAALIDENLVAVKVDREEHPEVDAVLLAAAAAFTPHLGWPLTVFTTPDGRPFHAGTYWPDRARGGLPAFRDVVRAVSQAWTDRRAQVDDSAEALHDALVSAAGRASRSSAAPALDQIAALADGIMALEDRRYGGFAPADAGMQTPKFPTVPVLRLLQSAALAEARPEAADVARRALEAMAGSELRDGIDGGFFRYATRRDWTVPHYERMLTDNAGLIEVALDAGRSDVARGVAEFLLSTLRRPDGAFAAAQDSESTVDGRRSEGGFYRADAASRERLEAPAVDGKVVTAWNGLAIGALARTGAQLDSPGLVAGARRAAEAVRRSNLDASGAVRHASLGSTVSPAPATLEDHGALAQGLIALACVTGELGYADEARRLVGVCVSDGEARVPSGRDPVLARLGAPTFDDADTDRPAGASALAAAALSLWELGAGERYRQVAERIVGARFARARDEPFAHGALLAVAARLTRVPRTLVVLVPGPGDPLARDVFRIRADTVVVLTEAQARDGAERGFALLEDRVLRDGRATAYDCRGFTCRLPVHSIGELAGHGADTSPI